MAQVDLYQYINEIKGMLNGQRYAEAAVHCQHILKSYPRHVEIYRLFATSLMGRQMYDEAADLYQRILSVAPADFNAIVNMAKIANAQRRYEDAIRYLEQAVDLDPYNQPIKKRLQDISAAAKQKRAAPSVSRAGLGILHFRSRLYRQSIQELRAVAEEQPQRLDVMQFLAEAYWRSNKNVEAVNVCQQIMEKLPDCVKANAILAETWLRTDKIAGAQKHLRLVQALTLPAQNKLEPDAPEGQAFLTRDSIEIPKQITVPFLEDVDVTEGLYDDQDDWGTDLFYVDDLGLTQEEDGGEEQAVEVDFFALLESADAEEVFAFDEAAEEEFETADSSSSWLTSATQSDEFEDEVIMGEPEVDSSLLSAPVTGSLGDAPDWLSDIEEDATTYPTEVEEEDDEMPAWLNETGELRDPFETGNAPSWLEDVSQEQEKPQSDLFMTDEELAGLWQHRDEGDTPEEQPVSDFGQPMSDEDEFDFLQELDGGGREDNAAIMGSPSLIDTFGFGSEPAGDRDDSDAFSFLSGLEGDGDDGMADGFGDWMSATGEVSVDDSLLAGGDFDFEGDDQSASEDEDEVDDLFSFLDAEDDGAVSEAAVSPPPIEDAVDSFDDDFSWLGEDGEGDGAADDSGSFTFDLSGDDFMGKSVSHAEKSAGGDLDDFAFLDDGDASRPDDLSEEGLKDYDDETFSDVAPDWLMDMTGGDDQDASILSTSHTSRLLLPEDEAAPSWLSEASNSDAKADDSIELLDLDNTVDNGGEESSGDEISWLADLEDSSSKLSSSDLDLGENWESSSLTEEQEAPDWLKAFDAPDEDVEATAFSDDIASADEVDLPAWTGELTLDSLAAEGEAVRDDWLSDFSIDESTVEADTSSDELDTPDWLSDMTLDEEDDAEVGGDGSLGDLFGGLDDGERADASTDGDDWLSAFSAAEDEDEDGAIEDETPDWLSGGSFADDGEGDESALAPDLFGALGEDESDSAADWLSDMTLDEEDDAEAGDDGSLDDLFGGLDDGARADVSTDGGDWLSAFSAAEDEDEGGAIEDKTPDWLSGGSFDDDGEGDESALAPDLFGALGEDESDSAADWLSGMTLDEEDDTEVDGDGSLDDLFGGLDDGERADVPTDGGDWLSAFSAAEDEDEDGAIEDETPDWLSGGSFADDGEGDESALAPDLFGALGEDERDSAADWLSGMTLDEEDDAEVDDDGLLDDLFSTAESAEDESSNDDWSADLILEDSVDTDMTIPVWLSDEDESLDTTEDVDSLTDDQLDNAFGLPDWLQDTIEEDANQIDTGELDDMFDFSSPTSGLFSNETGSVDNDEGDEDLFGTAVLPPLPDVIDAPPPSDDTILLNQVPDEIEELRLSGWLDEVNLDQEDQQPQDDVGDIGLEDAAASDGPVDWMTGLPVTESAIGDMPESSMDAAGEDALVTDWLTGEIVDKEDDLFDLDEAPIEEPEWMGETLAGEGDDSGMFETGFEEIEDLFASADDEESNDSDLHWLSESEMDQPSELEALAETNDNEFVASPENDALMPSESGMEDLSFLETDDEEDLPWLRSATDEVPVDDALTEQGEDGLDLIWQELQTDEDDLDVAPEALPEWFDDMLGGADEDFLSLESDQPAEEPSAIVLEATQPAHGWLPADDAAEEDGGIADLSDGPELPETQLNELAEGLAELAADSGDDQDDEFDERPLVSPVGDSWLTGDEDLDSDTWLGEELITADVEDMGQSETFVDADQDSEAIPSWLTEDISLEEDDDGLLEPTQPSQDSVDAATIESEAPEVEELEDVLSWLESLALQSDDE